MNEVLYILRNERMSERAMIASSFLQCSLFTLHSWLGRGMRNVLSIRRDVLPVKELQVLTDIN